MMSPPAVAYVSTSRNRGPLYAVNAADSDSRGNALTHRISWRCFWTSDRQRSKSLPSEEDSASKNVKPVCLVPGETFLRMSKLLSYCPLCTGTEIETLYEARDPHYG